jgi:hypothetical protein
VYASSRAVYKELAGSLSASERIRLLSLCLAFFEALATSRVVGREAGAALLGELSPMLDAAAVPRARRVVEREVGRALRELDRRRASLR